MNNGAIGSTGYTTATGLESLKKMQTQMQTRQVDAYRSFFATDATGDGTSKLGAAPNDAMSTVGMNSMLNFMMITMLMQSLAKITGTDFKTLMGGAAAPADSDKDKKPAVDATITPAGGSKPAEKKAGLSDDKKSYVVGKDGETLEDVAKKIIDSQPKLKELDEAKKKDKVAEIVANLGAINGISADDGKELGAKKVDANKELKLYAEAKPKAVAKPEEGAPATPASSQKIEGNVSKGDFKSTITTGEKEEVDVLDLASGKGSYIDADKKEHDTRVWEKNNIRVSEYTVSNSDGSSSKVCRCFGKDGKLVRVVKNSSIKDRDGKELNKVETTTNGTTVTSYTDKDKKPFVPVLSDSPVLTRVRNNGGSSYDIVKDTEGRKVVTFYKEGYFSSRDVLPMKDGQQGTHLENGTTYSVVMKRNATGEAVYYYKKDDKEIPLEKYGLGGTLTADALRGYTAY